MQTEVTYTRHNYVCHVLDATESLLTEDTRKAQRLKERRTAALLDDLFGDVEDLKRLLVQKLIQKRFMKMRKLEQMRSLENGSNFRSNHQYGK